VELVLVFPVAFGLGRQGGGIGPAVAGWDVDDPEDFLPFRDGAAHLHDLAAPSKSIQTGAKITLTRRRARRP
jgi:hypothetical protein